MMKHKSDLRIDYFNDFPLDLTGAESIHVYEICQNLQKAGCDVRLFSPATVAPLASDFNYQSVSTPNIAKPVLFQLIVTSTLIRQWRQHKPDAIYLRVSPTLILPAILARLFRIPLYPEVNGTIVPELKKGGAKLGTIPVLRRIPALVESLTYRTAQRIITVTDNLKTYICDVYHVPTSKVSVIINGVDTDTLKPLPHASKSSDIIVGYIGGLMWWQGLDFVIRALAQANTASTHIRLHIYGDGSERAALEALASDLGISDRVVFKGRISHDHVSAAMAEFDICIAYYVKARAGLNSPFKIFEYLSCGKPVIASDINGPDDIFRGIVKLVPAEDPAALAAAISTLANDKTLRTQMGTEARAFVTNGHSWYDVARQIKAEIQASQLHTSK